MVKTAQKCICYIKMRSCLFPPAVYTTNSQAEGAHETAEPDDAKPATNPQTQEFV